MIDHLISSTLAALVAIAAALALRRRSAGLRYAVLLAALLRFALPTGWLAEFGSTLARSFPTTRPPAQILGDLLLMHPGAIAIPAAQPASRTTVDLLWLLWAAGFAICLGIWIGRLWRTVPAVRQATPAEAEAFFAARCCLRINLPVELRIVAADRVPGARGCWRPCVLLPEGLAGQLDAAELQSLLVHELAHVRRRDNLSAAAARAIVSTFWFHPLLWWIERRMLAERERACDELVLGHGARAEDYVSGILKVCRMAVAGPAGYAGATGSNLKNRMEQIMSASMCRPSSRTLRAALGVLIALSAMVPLAGGFLRAQQPVAAQRRDAVPNVVDALMDQARSHLKQGEYEAALKSAAEILKANPSSQAARLVQATALMGMKRYDDARDVLMEMLHANPNSTDALFQMGVLNRAQNRYADAEDAFRKVYQLEPENSRGLMGVVEVYMSQKREEEALQLLQTEIAKNPARADYRLALGNAAVRAGKYDLAIAEFKALAVAAKDSQEAGDLYLRLGESYRRKGDSNGAIAALEHARDLLPGNIRVLSTLALTLDSAGRKQEARQAYEEGLKLDPRNGVALNNLAYLLSESGGDLDQALQYVQRARELLPGMYEVADTLGWIYMKRGQTDEAIATFREVTQKQPTHSTYHYHLAMALDQKGDRATAAQELRAALQDNPSVEERQKIQELMAKIGR